MPQLSRSNVTGQHARPVKISLLTFFRRDRM